MKSSAIVIMSRVPVPYKTKTRLMKKLSGVECAIFHLACLSDIFKVVGHCCEKFVGCMPYVFYTDGTPEQFKRLMLYNWIPGDIDFEWNDRFIKKITYCRQEGNDLGERLYLAAKHVLSDASKAIFLGADVPEITTELLSQAFESLDNYDVVLGPAYDGGYYLLGIKQPYTEIFQGIPWGSADVLKETLLAAGAIGLNVQLLEEKCDVDTWEDLMAFYLRNSANVGDNLKNLAAYRFANKLILGRSLL